MGKKMSLINVEINANVDRFETVMFRAADIADTSMMAAAANADKFQTAFDRASMNVSQSSNRMASDFEAANDRVMNASDQTISSIDQVAKATEKVDMRSWQEKTATAFGAGVGAGVVAAQTWIEKVEDFAKTKLILLGAAVAAGVTVAAATAIYTAYKVVSGSLGFVAGLFSGDSYKSENIDALITLNNEVRKLQDGLRMSAPAAGALNEALKAGGVSSTAYVSTLDAATKAAHENSEELDRLGVKYKDSNGHILSQRTLLENAKTKLDEYTEGYDRNAAAAAIGMGNYKEISNALSITTEKVEAARQRLIDYNLVIGPGTQAAVKAYEESMRAFQRETDLTSTGFKKAIADQIMPLLTDLADFFRDGFPGAVNFFRYSMAVITSLFYGLKEVVYIVSESIVASLDSIEIMLTGVAIGGVKLLTGDFKGAADTLASAWESAKNRVGEAGQGMVIMSERNAKAMKLAWGMDTIDAASGLDTAEEVKKGRDFVAKPKKKDGSTSSSVDPNSYENFVQRLQRENAALEQNEYTMLKVEAAQKAWKEGKDATSALLAIEQRQILASDKAVRDFTAKLEEENVVLINKRGAIGLVGTELDVYNMREQKRLEAISKVNEAERAGKPVTDAAREAITQQAEASATAAEAILRQNAALERSFDVGAKKAFTTYLDDAGNAAKGAATLFGNAFRGMEDSLTKFARTGKLDFRSLTDSIITDLLRMQVQSNITKPLAGLMNSGGGLFSSIGSFFGLNSSAPVAAAETPARQVSVSEFMSSVPSFDVGTNYVPEDMLAQIHKGEMIVPAAFNPVAGAPAGSSAPVINLNIIGAPSQPEVKSSRGAGGEFNMEVIFGNFENRLASNMASGRGPVASTLKSNFGLGPIPGM